MRAGFLQMLVLFWAREDGKTPLSSQWRRGKQSVRFMSRARETSSDARLQAQQINTQAVLALNPAGNLVLTA